METILNQAFHEILVSVIVAISALIVYGLKLLREWVKAKTASINDKQLRESLEWAFDRLDKTASTVVVEIEQALKKTEKKIDSAQKLAAAVRRVNLRLPAEAMQRLQQSYTSHDIEKIVKGKIESKVFDITGAK